MQPIALAQVGGVSAAAPGPISVTAAPRAWSVGQVLTALVVAAPRDSEVTLRVAGTVVNAQTNLPLLPGQRLQLQVEHSHPVAQLRVLQGAVGTPRTSAGAEQRLLTDVLSRQRPVAEALAGVASAEAVSGSAQPPLPPALRDAVRALLAQLPDAADAAAEDGARLRGLTDRSGTFLEATLARQLGRAPGPDLVQDMKLKLLSLREQLQAATPSAGPELRARLQGLTGSLDAALARIEMNQVLSARAADLGAAVWHADVPLAGAGGVEPLSMRIRRERRGSGAHAHRVWSVELTIAPPGLGPVHARVALSPEGVYATLSTPDESAFDALQGELQSLASALAEAGLAVGGVRCRRAEIEPGTPDDLPPTLFEAEA